jgi:hypothetical protein
VTYRKPRADVQPRAVLIRMDVIVDDMLTDHTIYDSPNGFEDSRPVGTVYMDATDFNYYTWNGTGWTNGGRLPVGQLLFVRRQQAVYRYDNTGFTLVWVAGQSLTRPPLLMEPAFNAGIAWGTFAYGMLTDARTIYPDAYEILQHPGDCEGSSNANVLIPPPAPSFGAPIIQCP